MDEYHLTVREAVADRIAELFAAEDPIIDVAVTEQDELHPEVVDLPAVVVSFGAGDGQIQGGTNASDYIGFPVLVSYLTVQPNMDTDPPGARTTKIIELIRRGFNQKRLAALPDAFRLTYRSGGQPVDERPMEQLRAQMVITAEARILR